MLREPSKRTKREPYVPEPHVAKVIEYWQEYAPATDDNAVEVDDLAETITPSNDRNCAAILMREAPALPLVAMNTWNAPSVEGGGAAQHAQVFAAGAYERALWNVAQAHAEMKILQYSYAEGLGLAVNYIGISKPCCLRCAVVMKIRGFKSRGCGGGLWSAGWAIPPFIKENPGLLEAFMGKEEYDWYMTLTDPNKADFLLRLQNAKD